MKENSFCMYDFINEVANDYNAHVHYKKRDGWKQGSVGELNEQVLQQYCSEGEKIKKKVTKNISDQDFRNGTFI